MENISIFEKLASHIRYWQDFFQMVKNVKKTFKNSNKILLKAFKNNFPIQAILKDGSIINLQSFNALYFISNIPNEQKIEYDLQKNFVQIHFSDNQNNKIVLHGGLDNGDIVYIFFKKDYDWLPVKNKVILDIGANIGDSSIFFALNGAKKVIGVEPYPKNFQLASKNIDENKLNNIELLLAGCGSKKRMMKVDPNHESNIESKLQETDDGINVPIVTLKNLIEKFNIPLDSILKIDCEGCEYDIIMNTPNDVISQFNFIQIEYHSGYSNLKRKLESIGYQVKISKPHATDVLNSFFAFFKGKKHDIKSSHEIGYVGFIYAKKSKKD